MLQFFRKFFSSKIGIILTLAFLGLIAVAFASSDVANTSVFGGVSGGDRVAVVGDRKISTSDLTMSANNAVDGMRQDNPTMTMQAFVAQGGLNEVLEQMLNRSALAEFGREMGLRSGKRLVDSEIREISAFRGADGNFDDNAFRLALQQRGLTEATVRDDLAMGIFARQLLTPVTIAPTMPRSVARRYASLLRERRAGAIAAIPAAVFAPEGDPTDEQLAAYYAETRSRYVRPERRVIRYATFGDDALRDLAPPTEEQIAARYRRDRAQYAAIERRSFTQLIVPTEAAAQAIIDEVEAGKSLPQAAQEKGLATAPVRLMSQTEFTTEASSAVAQAGFAAEEGELAEPARGGLGWYVLRVDDIQTQQERPLASVRADIEAELSTELRAQALSDMTARIEEELIDGRGLSDVAEELGVEINRTPPATADGNIYGQPGTTLPEELARIVPVAFDMDEGEPQLGVVTPGERFVIFDVAEIQPSLTAPLDEIREDVIALWRRDRGSERARQAADRVLARMNEGSSLEEAVEAEESDLPPVEQVAFSRQDIAQLGQVPPVLALFFSMAEDTSNKLEDPNTAAWFVVHLDEIEAPDIAADDQIVAATVAQLSSVAANEYIAQFMSAVRGEVRVERNEAAIEAVASQLTGEAN